MAVLRWTFFCCIIIATLTTLVTLAERLPPDQVEAPRSRIKREATCAPKFSYDSEDHTACLPGGDTAAASVAERAEIVDLHNEKRRTVIPAASDMTVMRWDEEVAMVAEKWAANCEFGHDSHRNIPGRFSVGQNVYASSSSSSWTGAIERWHSEVEDFTYGDEGMRDVFHDIGHYTAMVWAKTTLIGCGRQDCRDEDLGTYLFVCNYAEAGNYLNSLHEPYTSGSPCDDCPGHCVDSLCDCELTCLNGATLDLNTCACSCVMDPPRHVAPDCALNCTMPDPDCCESSCSSYKPKCPHRHDICPYAGIDYEDAGIDYEDDDSGTTMLKGRNPTICLTAVLCFTAVIFLQHL